MYISFQDLHDPSGVISKKCRLIFIGLMRGEGWMLIQPWHVIYQFSVFFLDENNENPFWASCRKIRLLVLNYPVTFVLGLARCSSALCLLVLLSKAFIYVFRPLLDPILMSSSDVECDKSQHAVLTDDND